MLSKWRETREITVTDDHTSILGIEFSVNARYLAVAYATRTDIWDLKQTNSSRPLARYDSPSSEKEICHIAWSQECPQLVICLEGGSVYVITMHERSSAILGFHHSGRQQEGKVSAVFLRENLLAVSMGNTVEIRSYAGNDCPCWELLKLVPIPPIEHRYPNSSLNLQSIHVIGRDLLLLSYESGAAILWSFLPTESLEFSFKYEDTFFLPGIVNDVCSKTRSILVTAPGTYQVFFLGSTIAQRILIPCDPLLKTPQAVSCAKYISEDLIIGTGVGHNPGQFLSSLALPTELNLRQTLRSLAPSVPEKDSAWIVVAHGSKVTFWETNVPRFGDSDSHCRMQLAILARMTKKTENEYTHQIEQYVGAFAANLIKA
ncbi:hypothetical protein F5879DRAFT_991088 [Lentinula edodes]|nr:hypothetical protein F5879DRAFT_991088 [Lentinula edodes]